jgi:hypothetical protein
MIGWLLFCGPIGWAVVYFWFGDKLKLPPLPQKKCHEPVAFDLPSIYPNE